MRKTRIEFNSDLREQYAAQAANIIELGSASGDKEPLLGSPVVQADDLVGEALASALRAAMYDGDWAVVERLTEALDARLPRAPVVDISVARARRAAK